MMVERGLLVAHTTIYRWVQRYAPARAKRVRAQLGPTNDSWRIDETWIKVRGSWMYLYRAVDSAGQTMEFMLSPSATPGEPNASSVKRSARFIRCWRAS